MNLGAFLRETRKSINLTQEEIAPLVHISRPTVSKLENGERALKAEDLINWLQVVQSRVNTSNTTPLEAGITFVNGVDIVVLTEMLTQAVSGFIRFGNLLI